MKQLTFKTLALTALITSASTAFAQQAYQYQSPEVWAAWAQGYKGQNTVINVHDGFTTVAGFNHGAWVSLFASTTAPSASVVGHQYGGQAIVGITPNKLNIFNMSYGIFTARGSGTYVASTEAIIGYAQKGQAIITKSAGNEAIPVGHYTSASHTLPGTIDGLAVRLAGQQSAILVGALSKNGTTASPASMASYSNTAGTSPVVQSNFLVVGVDSSALGGLAGTSFAAPIVAGYAAILASKFTTASATAVTNQLLNTARTDTVAGYNPAIYGRGEASISRALAPVSIR
jgi:subtilisin family serine protease